MELEKIIVFLIAGAAALGIVVLVSAVLALAIEKSADNIGRTSKIKAEYPRQFKGTPCPKCSRGIDLYKLGNNPLRFLERCERCGWERIVPEDENAECLAIWANQCRFSANKTINKHCQSCKNRVGHKGTLRTSIDGYHCRYGLPVAMDAKAKCPMYREGDGAVIRLLADKTKEEWFQLYLASEPYYQSVGVTFEEFAKVTRGLELM